jgi:hypothetical protein
MRQTNAQSESWIKTRCRRVFIYLLVGLAFNLAFAWLCVLVIRGDSAGEGSGTKLSRPDLHTRYGISSTGQAYEYVATNGFGVKIDQVCVDNWSLGVMSAGFPFSSLTATWHPFYRSNLMEIDLQQALEVAMWANLQGWEQSPYRDQTIPPATPTSYSAGVQLSLDMGHARERRLPIRPMWIGLVGNTLFYGVAVGLMSMCASRFKRRRPRQGLCMRCRYPVRGLAKCPECGTVVEWSVAKEALA